MLTYFAAVGHIIAESGGSQALVETRVLASGSLNGFITQRHYNRYTHTLSPEFHDQLQKL